MVERHQFIQRIAARQKIDQFLAGRMLRSASEVNPVEYLNILNEPLSQVGVSLLIDTYSQTTNSDMSRFAAEGINILLSRCGDKKEELTTRFLEAVQKHEEMINRANPADSSSSA